MRKSLIALLVVATAIPATAFAAPLLRESVIVSGDTVLLSDLVTDAGDAGSNVVALSPEPGKSLAFSASDVVAVAHSHGLEVAATPGLAKVLVERSAKLITTKEVTDALTHELAQRGYTGNLNVNLFSRRIEIRVPVQSQTTVEVLNMEYDPINGQLWAELRAPAGDPRAEKLQIQGRVERIVQVPVLKNQMTQGTVLTARDFEMRAMPENRLNAMVVTDKTALIGQALRRSIGPGEALVMNDVERPILVQRNAMVTMIYAKPGIALTSMGHAVDPGSKGDTIHVAVAKTNRTVEAIVTGVNEVTIRAAAEPASFKTAAQ